MCWPRCVSRACLHTHDTGQPAAGLLPSSAALLPSDLPAGHLLLDARLPCEPCHDRRPGPRDLVPKLDGAPQPRGHLPGFHAVTAELCHAATPRTLAQVVFAAAAVVRHPQEAVQHRARDVPRRPDGGLAQTAWARLEEARQVHGSSPEAGRTPLRRRRRWDSRIAQVGPQRSGRRRIDVGPSARPRRRERSHAGRRQRGYVDPESDAGRRRGLACVDPKPARLEAGASSRPTQRAHMRASSRGE